MSVAQSRAALQQILQRTSQILSNSRPLGVVSNNMIGSSLWRLRRHQMTKSAGRAFSLSIWADH